MRLPASPGRWRLTALVVLLVVVGGWFAVRGPVAVPLLARGDAGQASVGGPPAAPAAAGPRLSKQAFRARATAQCRAASVRDKAGFLPTPSEADFAYIVEAVHVEITRQRAEWAAMRPPAEWDDLHRAQAVSLQRALRANGWMRTRIASDGLQRSDIEWWLTELKAAGEQGDNAMRLMGVPECVSKGVS